MNDKEIIKAIKTLNTKYGIFGLKGKYLLATDVDGDLRIAPVGLLGIWLKDRGFANANDFMKVKDLI